MAGATTKRDWAALGLPAEVVEILKAAPSVTVAERRRELIEAATGGPGSRRMEVAYDLPDGRRVVEAEVVRVRNGVSANYTEAAMRRRDPDCMLIADEKPTDKPHYRDRFGGEFEPVRQEAFEWLKGQDLAIFAFHTGKAGLGGNALAVCPANAAFFALGLAMLQGVFPIEDLKTDLQSVIYVIPTFRHTHYDGRQIVVHNRRDEIYEMFSFNLYPGPSAKKGVYGMLIGQGEIEGWVTAHCSTVQVVTPYDNLTTIMHEGASGGGKSEMLQQAHRLPDGRLLLGENTVTGERRYLEIPRMCELKPVTDDMALCHPQLQRPDGKLWVTDAENAWFVRVDHILEYGTDHDLEKLTAQPPEPLLFLNIDAVADSRAMIWEHIQDEPGKPCPNPRVIIPRELVPDVVHGEVPVDVRSMGVRTPPCTREQPSYGILGLMHVLPPALAYIWRLIAPRGFANPSITVSEGLSSEGVGSYWPFATGRKVPQANLLMRQFEQTPAVRYILTPNQHIGCWRTGFMPQWIARDYLARRGSARFQENQIKPARCPLLGYALHSMRVEGTHIPHLLLETQLQPEIGEEGYDQGAEQLYEFVDKTLREFLEDDLDAKARSIIECCLDRGSMQDYEALMPVE